MVERINIFLIMFSMRLQWGVTIKFMIGFSWLVRRVLSLTSDPTDDVNIIKVDPKKESGASHEKVEVWPRP